MTGLSKTQHYHHHIYHKVTTIDYIFFSRLHQFAGLNPLASSSASVLRKHEARQDINMIHNLTPCNCFVLYGSVQSVKIYYIYYTSNTTLTKSYVTWSLLTTEHE